MARERWPREREPRECSPSRFGRHDSSQLTWSPGVADASSALFPRRMPARNSRSPGETFPGAWVGMTWSCGCHGMCGTRTFPGGTFSFS